MLDSPKLLDISRGDDGMSEKETLNEQLEMIEDSRIKLYRLNSLMLKCKVLRNLIAESSGQFRILQKEIDSTEHITRDFILKKSRVYRAVLEVNIPSNSATPTDLEAKNMLKNISILWHLCEILYIDILSPGFLIDQLLIWIRYHDDSLMSDADALMKTNNVHEQPNFWTILVKFICRGEVQMAANLLKLHPKCETSETLSMIHSLMQKKPHFTRDSIKYEFFARWQAWNLQVKSHLKKSVFTSPEEKLILGLLYGDFATFTANKALFGSWYQMVVAFLHFSDPLIANTDLPVLAQECLRIFADIRSEEQATPFDRALLAAFSYDLMAVAQESCSSFQDNWWFLSHFLNLLYHGGILDANEIEEPRKLASFFLRDYAELLMTDTELWPNAVDYFAACPEYGLESLRLQLQNVPLDCEDTAIKIIDISERFNFDDVIRVVSLVIARKALLKNNLGQALTWSARSRSPVLASHIADIFLKHFVEKKEFPDEEALKNLGHLMLASDRLTFLAKYYEFIELRDQGSLSEAGVQLENLITSKIAPSFFIFTLLMDSIPLLESDKIILDSEQTYQVLVTLDNYLKLFNNVQTSETKENETILRHAISHNMARAMINGL